MASTLDSESDGKAVRFDPNVKHAEDGKEQKQEEDEWDAADFMETFSEHVAQKNYTQALDLCSKRLKAKPEDKYVLELKETVQVSQKLDAIYTDDPYSILMLQDFLESADHVEKHRHAGAPAMEELCNRAAPACVKSFEAMFKYLSDGEVLWALGEQAIGIFWDTGRLAPPGSHCDRLLEISQSLLKVLSQRLAKLKASDSTLGPGEWLFEALGQLWWRREFDLSCQKWLLDGICVELTRTKGSMKELVGFSSKGLKRAELSELDEILVQTCTLERTLICGLLGDRPALPSLGYGVEQVLAEVCQRPLVEPPFPGFSETFSLMTSVVYVLNSFNACLPSKRAECPWLFSYLERCLGFWLREVQRDVSHLPASIASRSWAAEGVEAIAQAVDCLRGLDEEEPSILVRQGIAWLLSRQEADGLFYAPGVTRPADSEFNYLHPSWRAVAALQLDRQMGHCSDRCSLWAGHARGAAKRSRLAEGPPSSGTKEMRDTSLACKTEDEDEEDEDEGDDAEIPAP